MKTGRLSALILCLTIAVPLPVMAQQDSYSFAVLAHLFRHGSDEDAVRSALSETDGDNLAFVVANGIKASDEPCSDQLYERRHALYQSAQNGLILSLAASDWTECRHNSGEPAAIARLNRIREIFFISDFSLGSTRIPLVRQSATAHFHSYAENTRWEFGNVVFATVNLPSGNNHYLAAAGRNSEFEDRLVANRYWLQRIFSVARWKKMQGIVLFSDANPLDKPVFNPSLDSRRDGFAEIRDELAKLTVSFPGRVLLVHNGRPSGKGLPNTINWRDNLGTIAPQPEWVKITVDPQLDTLFAVSPSPVAARARRQ